MAGNSVYFTDVNTGYIVGDFIWKTIDGGTTWTSLLNGSFFAYSVYFTDANTGYVVGYDGMILKTIDGGATWNSSSSGTLNYLFSVCFTDANNGYTVGANGTILKTTDGGGFPVGLPEFSSKSNTLNIYPNPSSDKITIEISAIPAKSQLSIMNLSGQQLITRQINEPKTQIDISSLPSGVYFVRLTGESTVEVKKLIKQ